MNLRLEKQKEMPAKKRPLKTNPHKPVDGRGPSPSRHAPSDQTGVARPRSRRVKSIIHQKRTREASLPGQSFIQENFASITIPLYGINRSTNENLNTEF
jgi:hypothetical protein